MKNDNYSHQPNKMFQIFYVVAITSDLAMVSNKVMMTVGKGEKSKLTFFLMCNPALL